MRNADDRRDPRLSVVFILLNVVVVGVWAFTVVNEWFLHTQESALVYLLTIFGGGPASLIGLAVSAGGLSEPEQKHRRLWRATMAVNGVGLVANFVGFVVYMAPAC